MLSKGDIWVFGRKGGGGFEDYVSKNLSSEKIGVITFNDANHLRALFEKGLSDLNAKKKTLSKVY